MSGDQSQSTCDDAAADVTDPSGFCAECLAATSDDSAGHTMTFNLIGTGLFGGQDRCPNCDSVVSTLWAVALIPVIPFESYRVIERRGDQYLSRSTRRLAWRQVFKTYTFSFALIGITVLVAKWSHWMNGSTDSL